MFDFAWSEIALIAVVAMIAIGPKDMPVAIRAVTGWIKKARRMAAEFQTHVDEMVREADLSEVRASINEIRNFDFRGEIEKTIDADGSIRSHVRVQSAGRRRRRARRPRSRRSRSASRWCEAIGAAGGTGGGRDAVHAARRPSCRRTWCIRRRSRTPAKRSRRPSSRRMSCSSAARVRQPEPTTMADIEQDDPIDDKPMPLLEHLVELRRRLMWAVGAFVDLLHRLVLLLQPASTSSWPSRWRRCCASRAIPIRT